MWLESMVKVENIVDVIKDVEAALRPQSISHVDVDLVLPPGSISPFREEEDGDEKTEEEDLVDPTLKAVRRICASGPALWRDDVLADFKNPKSPVEANRAESVKVVHEGSKDVFATRNGRVVRYRGAIRHEDARTG